MHTALTELYSENGFTEGSGGTAAGVGAAAAAPIAAAGALGNAATHLTLLGVIAFLLLMWGLVRIAGFRFIVSTGVGR